MHVSLYIKQNPNTVNLKIETNNISNNYDNFTFILKSIMNVKISIMNTKLINMW